MCVIVIIVELFVVKGILYCLLVIVILGMVVVNINGIIIYFVCEFMKDMGLWRGRGVYIDGFVVYGLLVF